MILTDQNSSVKNLKQGKFHMRLKNFCNDAFIVLKVYKKSGEWKHEEIRC